MAGRYGDNNPNMKYYNDYRNKYYNPDDEINRPGRNVNWKDIQQGFYLVEGKDNAQDSSIAALEEKEAEQDARLTVAEEKNAEQDGRLDAIEDEQTEQNARLTAIEAEQVTQNGLLDVIKTEQVTQNGRLDAIETKNGEQDQAIAAIRAKDTEQDAALADQAEQISDLDTRLTDAEGDIQNENQRNTAQDAAIADNSARITRIEDYGARIALIEAEQVTQNNEIDALQAADQVFTQSVARIDAKDADQDQAIAALQTKDAELDNDIDGLDTRISGVEDAIDTRLTAVEQKNTEQDATLANHETRITDNTLRNTAQETAIADNSERITRLENGQTAIDSRVDVIENQLASEAPTTRETPADTEQPRETVIGTTSSNFTVEAAKNQNGESMTLTDTANGDAVSVGFTSDGTTDKIIVGGNEYTLGAGGGPTETARNSGSITARIVEEIASGSSAYKINYQAPDIYKLISGKHYNLMPLVLTDNTLAAVKLTSMSAIGSAFYESVVADSNGKITPPTLSFTVTNTSATTTGINIYVTWLAILSY